MRDLLPPLVPYPFQEADIEFLLAQNLSGFLSVEVGGGKSIIATEAVVRGDVDHEWCVVVITTESTIDDVWGWKVTQQDNEVVPINVRDAKQDDGSNPALDALVWSTPGWYVMTHQFFTKLGPAFWKSIKLDAMIVDEAHLLSNRQSAGGKILRKYVNAKRRMALSGTMYRNNFENMWNLVRWVYPDRDAWGDIADPSYDRWSSQWCASGVDYAAMGGRKGVEEALAQGRPVKEKVSGEKTPGLLASSIPCWIQHRKRENCCEFHPEGFLSELEAPKVVVHKVGLTPNQKKAIDRMSLDYVAYLKNERDEKQVLIAKLPIVMSTRLRQMTLGLPSLRTVQKPVRKRNAEGALELLGYTESLEVFFDENCESPKLDKVIQRLGEEGDRPLLLAMSSQDFARETTRRLNALGISAVEWSGKLSKSKRTPVKEAFIAGEFRVLVCTTESISTGTDGLQFATNWIIEMENSQDLSARIQLGGRADRRGQTERVLHEIIVAIGSMDQKRMHKHLIAELNMNKSLVKLRNKSGMPGLRAGSNAG